MVADPISHFLLTPFPAAVKNSMSAVSIREVATIILPEFGYKFIVLTPTVSTFVKVLCIGNCVKS